MVVGPRNQKRCFSAVLTCCILLIFFGYQFNAKHFGLSLGTYDDDGRDNLPGAYLRYLVPSNASHCKFNYGLPEDFIFFDGDTYGSPELGASSPFRALYHVVESSSSPELPAVTYATHLTTNFLSYLTEVLRYWDGLVSVAAYVPDGDLRSIIRQLIHYCYCVPAMSRVSLHFVFRKNVTFKSTLSFNKGPPTSCDIIGGSPKKTEPPPLIRTNDSWYPVNVCRNVARSASVSDYVMVSDVELMPSKELARRFMNMIEQSKCPTGRCDKRVYVVPIFEVESTETVPRTKEELKLLLTAERATYFHRHICNHCQRFPGLEVWMESDPGDAIEPFLSVKRETPYHRWEPVYIGTKSEPFYNEALSWEGFQDKMPQMLELCLQGYKFVVLDGAFLVHWPGIKKSNSYYAQWRSRFVEINRRQYDLILKNLSRRYPRKPRCNAN
ncbi:beta-1,4-glucuronyltransferase 1-like [Cylas formicarius]|uniref:beta-1,4-glucuronyltransferase 1-like n=1 Tax=Cylas formicarius TaxID=197179 RepID=UPI00295875CA|nr:beta-1,4-glucuronyltransferase 1-like [Cylas formicarius]